VHRTIAAAELAVAMQAVVRRNAQHDYQRWSQVIDQALAVDRSAWRQLTLPCTRQGRIWVMARLLSILQDGRCAVCGYTKPLEIDHDHDTGLVRGALCHTCNTFEGRRDTGNVPTFVAYRTAPPAGGFEWQYKPPRSNKAKPTSRDRSGVREAMRVLSEAQRGRLVPDLSPGSPSTGSSAVGGL